ncbi:Glycine receptor subunit alpha-3 [Halocaridina rubra]|uniref:Glycine receptor subunit alpha-3 n=1 Tax=Halocaridina rubra TaxID=373956 RepID=A0AAN9AB56_HALRR
MSLMILWRKEFIEVVILCSIIVSTYSLNLIPEGYDPHIRPNGPDGEPVVVGISLVINSINEVDEREMSIVLEVYIRVAWHDPRLVIPPNLYNDSDCEDIPLNNEIIEDLHLWLPDPTIERVQDMHSAKLLQGFSGVRLSRDAKIMWGKWFLINLRCAMFFHNFPFDMQTCHLDISSYFYGTSDMLFTWEGNGIHASPDIPKLLSNYIFTFHQENVTSCYSVNYINDQYPCLKSVMTFTRRYRSYMMGVYFPSFIFVIVAWASFFWPPDAIPARTVLLITTLLATISLYAGVQQITPPTNYTRAIDNWFFACIVAIASALFQYAVILQ